MSLLKGLKTARILTNSTFKPKFTTLQNSYYSTMRALVYNGVGDVKIQEHAKPTITSPTDAIVKLTKTTICGTDLHIRGGDVATCAPGRILGHEGVGIIESVGDGVRSFKNGDHVLISCISSCGTCYYCHKGMYSHCTTGGWILGNTIDGTQAEYVRIPHADSSLYPIPSGFDEAALVMMSDIFPTGFECGVLRGKIAPGSSVVIIGSGPVGLAALITAQLYSPSLIIMVDMDENRLKVAKKFGANYTISPKDGGLEKFVKDLTEGRGADTVIEAVGLPSTFESTQDLIAPGGTIANVGVHGTKADLHLENLWDKNIAITTQLVDTSSTPMLLSLVYSGKLDPKAMITHEYTFDQMEEAYATFGAAAKHDALKVLIQF